MRVRLSAAAHQMNERLHINMIAKCMPKIARTAPMVPFTNNEATSNQSCLTSRLFDVKATSVGVAGKPFNSPHLVTLYCEGQA